MIEVELTSLRMNRQNLYLFWFLKKTKSPELLSKVRDFLFTLLLIYITTLIILLGTTITFLRVLPCSCSAV